MRNENVYILRWNSIVIDTSYDLLGAIALQRLYNEDYGGGVSVEEVKNDFEGEYSV